MIADLFLLLLTLGLPRFPDTNIPLIIIPLFLKFKVLHVFYRKNRTAVNIFNIFLLFYFIACFVVYANAVDLIFGMSLGLKIYLNFLGGILVGEVFERNIKSINYWIAIQISLMIASIFSTDIYLLMSKFISKDSSDVFAEIFGLRTLGFGLYHAEGAVLFVIIIYLVGKYGGSNYDGYTVRLMKLIGYTCAVALGRSAFIPIAVLIVRRNIFKSFVLGVMLTILAFNVTDDSQILYEGLEIFRNIAIDGELKTKSTDANMEMFFFPDKISTLLFGDGKFFNGEAGYSTGFYLGTDIGWIRMLFFGGSLILGLYFIINVYWIFFLRDKILAWEILFLFCVMNLKGIFIFVLSASIVFALDQKIKR
jgi:hypothetical protein